MKKMIATYLTLIPILGIAQYKLIATKKNVIPLNDTDSLLCYYFPLKANMENKHLPFYKVQPTLVDIQKIASNMPCDSFAVKRNGNTILTINLKKDSIWLFRVRERSRRVDTIFNAQLSGDMTEHRSIELINNGYDKGAGQVFGKFNFNNQQIPYITTKNMENAVLKVVDYFLGGK